VFFPPNRERHKINETFLVSAKEIAATKKNSV
jgi:hypothetical protein